MSHADHVFQVGDKVKLKSLEAFTGVITAGFTSQFGFAVKWDALGWAHTSRRWPEELEWIAPPKPLPVLGDTVKNGSGTSFVGVLHEIGSKPAWRGASPHEDETCLWGTAVRTKDALQRASSRDGAPWSKGTKFAFPLVELEVIS